MKEELAGHCISDQEKFPRRETIMDISYLFPIVETISPFISPYNYNKLHFPFVQSFLVCGCISCIRKHGNIWLYLGIIRLLWPLPCIEIRPS